MIRSQLPILVCDLCQKEIECVNHSGYYQMYNIHVSEYYQDGSDSKPYHQESKINVDVCKECYNKNITVFKSLRMS